MQFCHPTLRAHSAGDLLLLLFFWFIIFVIFVILALHVVLATVAIACCICFCCCYCCTHYCLTWSNTYTYLYAYTVGFVNPLLGKQWRRPTQQLLIALLCSLTRSLAMVLCRQRITQLPSAESLITVYGALFALLLLFFAAIAVALTTSDLRRHVVTLFCLRLFLALFSSTRLTAGR